MRPRLPRPDSRSTRDDRGGAGLKCSGKRTVREGDRVVRNDALVRTLQLDGGYALRAGRRAQQRRKRQASTAAENRPRHAVLVSRQMGIGVRLGAELGDEQRE